MRFAEGVTVIAQREVREPEQPVSPGEAYQVDGQQAAQR
jgi:hypothetical protein